MKTTIMRTNDYENMYAGLSAAHLIQLAGSWNPVVDPDFKAMLRNEQYGELIAHLEAVIQTQPQNRFAKLTLAKACSKTGNDQKAAQLFVELIDAYSTDSQVYYCIGDLFDNRGKRGHEIPPNALYDFFWFAWRHNKHDYITMTRMAQICKTMGDCDLAIHWYEKVLQAEPHNHYVLTDLAYLNFTLAATHHLAREEYLHKAWDYLSRVPDRHRDVHYQIACVRYYILTGQGSQAVQVAEKVVKEKPSGLHKMALVNALISAGEHARAIDTALRTAFDHRYDPAANDYVTKAYAASGNIEQALIAARYGARHWSQSPMCWIRYLHLLFQARCAGMDVELADMALCCEKIEQLSKQSEISAVFSARIDCATGRVPQAYRKLTSVLDIAYSYPAMVMLRQFAARQDCDSAIFREYCDKYRDDMHPTEYDQLSKGMNPEQDTVHAVDRTLIDWVDRRFWCRDASVWAASLRQKIVFTDHAADMQHVLLSIARKDAARQN